MLVHLAIKAFRAISPIVLLAIILTAVNPSSAWGQPFRCQDLFLPEVFEPVGGKHYGLREIIREPFPEPGLKLHRVQTALPMILKQMRDSGDLREFDFGLLQRGILRPNFMSEHRARFGNQPYPIEVFDFEPRDKDRKLSLTVVGNAVMKVDWPDFYGENFVVLFEGSQVVHALKLSTFLVSGYPEDQVILTRNLSSEELGHWQSNDLEGLIANGSRGVSGYNSNVLHFHLGEIAPYKVPQSQGLKIKISKETLRALDQAGLVVAGHIFSSGPDGMIFEMVFKEAAWASLLRAAKSVDLLQ